LKETFYNGISWIKQKSNAEDAAEKFKNNDNEQVDKVKDQINKYTGGKKDDT